MMNERLNRLERELRYLKWAGALVLVLMVALVLMSRSTTARYQIASPRDAFFVHRLDTSTGEIRTLALGGPDVERRKYVFQEIGYWPGPKEK
ncbi:MAG: hypothetical protein ACE5JQ_16950, partial [Candidatus Methylomirabilales bacterium]